MRGSRSFWSGRDEVQEAAVLPRETQQEEPPQRHQESPEEEDVHEGDGPEVLMRIHFLKIARYYNIHMLLSVSLVKHAWFVDLCSGQIWERIEILQDICAVTPYENEPPKV